MDSQQQEMMYDSYRQQLGRSLNNDTLILPEGVTYIPEIQTATLSAAD